MTDWVYDGKSYGAVNVFSTTPPTGSPDRVLQYTLVYPEGSNKMLSYGTNGTEILPNELGKMEKVKMSQVSLRSDYIILDSAAQWPADFFSTSKNCFFGGKEKAVATMNPAKVVPNQGVGGLDAANRPLVRSCNESAADLFDNIVYVCTNSSNGIESCSSSAYPNTTNFNHTIAMHHFYRHEDGLETCHGIKPEDWKENVYNNSCTQHHLVQTCVGAKAAAAPKKGEHMVMQRTCWGYHSPSLGFSASCQPMNLSSFGR
jgi:hypothetical protein